MLMDWHTLTVREALERLSSSHDGLSQEEAAARLAAEGPNLIASSGGTSAWQLLLAQFKNVLIIILLLATALSALIGHGLEALVIAVIVLFAILLGFVQEYRAERSIEALRRMAAPKARVRRGGRAMEVPAASLVPGDLVLLAAGDKVPADGRLLLSVNLRVEEASLTGESLPSDKDARTRAPLDATPGDRVCMVFAGTSVVYGRGEAVVAATGMQTEFGRIAAMLGRVESERTPLQKNLDRVGSALAKAALALVILIALGGLLRGQPFFDMLLFGIALAVAVVPEALPAVVAISLALGVQRMARRNALMRRLPAVETLGSTTVICSDKTGTLTRDEMTVRVAHTSGLDIAFGGSGYAPEGSVAVEGGGELPQSLQELLLAGVLCNDARLEQEEGAWRVAGDPTEGALLVAARKAGLDEEALRAQFPRTGEEPFSSESKRMATLHEHGEEQRLFVKGAPEALLQLCSTARMPDGERPLDEAARHAIREAADRLASRALRVLALASGANVGLEGVGEGMSFLGLVGMIDPPRPEAREAVRRCVEAGIRPVMITGDHPRTAAAIAAELGISGDGVAMTGRELEELDDASLRERVGTIPVFARVSPEHKLRLVEALQSQGEIVAMTGDGVNDAPALKRADIGISMGITGTDVSREASAMTLTDDNFASIVAAVEEGRGIYDNIRKYLTYLLSSNIGELGLVLGSTLLGLPLPLTAVQILYVNLATDGLPALALAVDPPEKGIMQRPPNDPKRGVFTPQVVSLMLTGGLWSTVANLLLFTWALGSGRPLEEAMTMTFVSLVLIQFFKAYAFRSEKQSVFRSPLANRWLNLAIVWELVLLVVIIAVPVLRAPFGTFLLTLEDWLIVTLAALTVLPVLELLKFFLRRGWLELPRR